MNSDHRISDNKGYISLDIMKLSDAEGYFEILSEKGTYQFLTDSPIDLEKAGQKIQSNRESTKNGQSIYWSIRGHDKHFMGFIATHNLQGEVVSISYGIHPTFRRKGIGTAALKMVLGWEGMKNKRIEVATHLENQASYQMLLKMDLSYQGVIETKFGRRHVFVKNE